MKMLLGSAVKAPQLLALIAAALATQAAAQQAPGGGPGLGSRSPPPPPQSIVHGSFGHGAFFPGFFYEREYVPVIEREVIREVPAEPAEPAAPPPPPRRPYVVGRSYSSLPGSCMKMIQDGGTYFLCSGEWYRQVGAGQYKAVTAPL